MTARPASGWLACEATRSSLSRLDRVLSAAVTTRDLELREIALHLVRQGGKRLRPALVLLVAGLGEASERRLLRAAAGVELLHVASLYHDDIMDRAPTRRGAPSANERWGNTRAAVAGTYLFARGMELLAAAGDEANRLAAARVADVCAGQLQELESAYDADLPEADHLTILERKTAALFVLPCRVGAALGGVPDELAAALERFARALGVAFQLADDALDLAGEAEVMGKATGTDLAEGAYGLPVLIAARGGGSAERLRSLLRRSDPSATELAEALEIVREGPGTGAALKLARQRAREAHQAVATLPSGPVRTSLERLSEYAVARAA